MPRDVAKLAATLGTVLKDGALRNLHAQAHARAMLVQLGTPQDQWPQFTETLDERLFNAAQLMLVRGMELVDTEQYGELGQQLLLRAAESLEFMVVAPQQQLRVFEESLNAAMAYHVAGYHARAYVLAERLRTVDDVVRDSCSMALYALLRRDIRSLAATTLASVSSADNRDGRLAARLHEGDLDDDDAIAALGRQSLCQAMLRYVEYAKRGSPALLAEAREQCRRVATLGKESRHVDLWWLGLAVEKLLRDLGDSSLWNGLRDISPDTPFGGAVDRYVEAALVGHPSTVTLWPSQRKALATIKAVGAPSFCIRMPTSAGKTKIAELCILRMLLDSNLTEGKCLYIAPFRSLAVEVEATLGAGLRPLGVRVSEIYGGFDLSSADERLISETQVLVATPEKFDAAVRLAPELLDDVRLIIVDEGHIAGDISERGLRAEFLINRLLWRLGRERCRHVFISAVLPNTAEFAAWIGGDPRNVVESDWRPSRLVLGECEWNEARGSVRLSITHEGSTQLQQEVFVQPFVAVRPVRGVPGCGLRRKPLPSDASEAFACSVIRFARYGTTLAFVPQARQVDGIAEHILTCADLLAALARAEQEALEFVLPNLDAPLVVEVLDVIAAELGPNSDVERFLRGGVAVHRGNLPGRVRVALERLIRVGEIRIIVATSTLGQGVNLPIRTVVVRGLQQDQHKAVDAMTFWNIAGRAGRAMRENEGQVLFFNDVGRPAHVVLRQRRAMRAIIDRSGIVAVIGLLHRVLAMLAARWNESKAAGDFAQLCQRLAEDDFEWVEEERRRSVREIVELVDQHLLALAVEGNFGTEQADALQEVLRESLLFAQLEARPIKGMNTELATEVLFARVRRVFARVPQRARREQFYKMGMSLKDCETIEASEEQLMKLVGALETWSDQSMEERLDALVAIAGIAMSVDATATAARTVPGNTLEIVRAWLDGQRCVEMIDAGLGNEFDRDAGKLGRFLEEYCVYGLAWVVSGFVSYVQRELEERGEQMPSVAEHVSAMFKLGVPDPLAAAFVPYLQLDRGLAIRVATLCPLSAQDVGKAIAWLHGLTDKEMEQLGLDEDEAAAIVRKRRQLPELTADYEWEAPRWRIRLKSAQVTRLRTEEPMIIKLRPDRSAAHYEIFDLRGHSYGIFKRKRGKHIEWLKDPLRMDAVVDSVKSHEEGGWLLVLRIRELAQ